MKYSLPLPQEKKLTIIFRVEPGCLGPSGNNHIDSFCTTAQKEFELIDADFIHWEIIPRYDKSLPEMQYKINNKTLSHDKAEKYLILFDRSLSEFETHLNTQISLLINKFMNY